MKTTYVDPWIRLNETDDQTLNRLSANIERLSGMINDAERGGQQHLTMLFSQARDARVAQAAKITALVTPGSQKPTERRPLPLTRRVGSTGTVPAHSRHYPSGLPLPLPAVQ